MRRLKRLASILTHNPLVDFHPSNRSREKKKLLLFARFDPIGPQTIQDQIESMCSLSQYDIDWINMYHSLSRLKFTFPRFLDFSQYQGLVLHNTICYDRDLLWKFVKWPDLRKSGIPIIVMRQDENIRVYDFIDFLVDINAKLLLTTVPTREWPLVYPKTKLPHLLLMNTLTGYVTDEMRMILSPTYAQRDIDVFYRAAENPPWFGNTTLEKYEVGLAMQKICQQKHLHYDISMRFEDRLGRKDWFNFLKRSRSVVGSESGASVFDFDGSLEKKSKDFKKRNPAATPREVWAKVIAPYEGNICYPQISPRHFEAAACRAVQILLAGDYSGIFIANRHFLTLEKDYSNTAEILDCALDPNVYARITEACFEEIIMDDKYHYRTFVAEFDKNVLKITT